MKKLNVFLTVSLLLTLLISCQKEKLAPPSAFSAAGFWSGALSTGPAILDILNKPDGTVRVYLREVIDTAAASFKLDGRYTVTGDNYDARVQDSTNFMRLQTTHTTTTSMGGVLFFRFTGDSILTSFPFEVAKQ
jgi:hypothetical protein